MSSFLPTLPSKACADASKIAHACHLRLAWFSFLANLQLAHTGEFWHALQLVQIIYYVRNRHFNTDDKTNKKPYKSTSPRGPSTCKALISSYNLDIIILFVLRFMPRSLNYIPARLTLADFAMFFAIEIIISQTNNVFAKPLSSIFFDNIILCSTQKNREIGRFLKYFKYFYKYLRIKVF